MKIKSNKLLFFVVSIIMFIATITLSINFSMSAKADVETEYKEGLIKSTYFVGEKFDVKSAKISDKEGNTVEANLDNIVFPNGLAYKVSEPIVLEECGAYTAMYCAEGVFAKKTFEVVVNKYEGLSTSPEVATKTFNNFSTEQTLEGLYTTFKNGETLVYNKPIKLNDNGKSNALHFYIDTTATGKSPIGRIDFSFTDIYDEENFVNFTFIAIDGNWYWRAGANGQPYGGLERRNKISSVQIDGVNYSYLTAYGAIDIIGSNIGHSITFENDTKRVYSRSEPRSWLNSGAEYKIITDLDEEKIVRGNKWKGFTTGEVYMTMTPSAFKGPFANFCITEIGEEKGKDLANEISKDKTSPVITLKKDIDESNIKVALNEKVDLFDIDVLDSSDIVSIKKEVFYNYGSAGEVRINIDNDAFIPKLKGVYTIKYSAIDSYGNVGVKIVRLSCVSTESGKSIDFSYNKLEKFESGKTYNLSDFEAHSINGTVDVKIYILYEDNVFEIEKSFVPDNVGKYTIKYVYGDGIKEYVETYDISCETSDQINIDTSNFATPVRFIKNQTYSLDKVLAYTYNENKPVSHIVNYYVSNDGADYQKIENYREYTVTAENTVKFKFEYETKSCESNEVGVVNVKDGESLDFKKYFVHNFTEVLSNDDNICFVTNGKQKIVETKFINPLLWSSLQLQFRFSTNNANFNQFKIIITDYLNNDNKVEIIYKKLADGIVLSGTGINVPVTVSRKFNDGAVFSLTYMSNINSFMFDDGNKFNIDLNRFESNKCNIAFEISEITGQSDLMISKINNQSISSIGFDDTEGEFLVNRAGGQYAINSEIKINIPTAVDVLSSVLIDDIKITVRTPDKKIAVSLDGVKLDNVVCDREYIFTADLLGTYIISYDIYDTNGNKSNKASRDIVNIIDSEKPQINLVDIENSGKVGKSIELAKYTVTDNITTSEKIRVFSIVYNSDYVEVASNVTEYTPLNKGVYTVIYYAIDEAGNSVTVSYKINVR